MDTAQNVQNNLVRRGFGLKGEVSHSIISDYHSELVERIKNQGGSLSVGRLTVRLAREFGFCYGVDIALNLVYETRKKFPDRRIFLLSELLHNPSISLRLEEIGVEILPPSAENTDRFSRLKPEDIILIPAFGATVSEYNQLQGKGCLVVDTTCPSVVAVWKRVERYAQDGFTAIIHGKYEHEETRATSSRTLICKGGKYLVVLNMSEAEYLCHYIVEGGDKQDFLSRFENACSPGFDPDVDLQRIGLANQTTMLKAESLEIAGMFRQAISTRYGGEEMAEHFRHFDTICSATQDRQDAVKALAQEDIDLMIVVGGFNSSNTSQLYKISSKYKPAYHVDSAGCIVSSKRIRHKLYPEMIGGFTNNWLPPGNVTLGLTAGASTPSRIVGEVIDRIVNCCFEDQK